jgi:hypothetical protein
MVECGYSRQTVHQVSSESWHGMFVTVPSARRFPRHTSATSTLRRYRLIRRGCCVNKGYRLLVINGQLAPVKVDDNLLPQINLVPPGCGASAYLRGRRWRGFCGTARRLALRWEKLQYSGLAWRVHSFINTIHYYAFADRLSVAGQA